MWLVFPSYIEAFMKIKKSLAEIELQRRVYNDTI